MIPNAIINTIGKITQCLQIPYCIILCLFLIKYRFRGKGLLIAIFLFMIIWRTVVNVSSSRYCISFIILSFMLYAANSWINKNRLSYYSSIVICLCLLFFNIEKTFSGFRNIFFYDIKECANRFATFSNSNVFLNFKDRDRIRNGLKNEYVYMFEPSIEEIFDYYSNSYRSQFNIDFLNNNSYIITAEKNNSNILDNKSFGCKRINQFKANRNKNIYSIYLLPKFELLAKKRLLFVSDSKISDLIQDGLLISYNPFQNFYVFRSKNELTWIIGTEYREGTEIIYQTFTDSFDLLSDSRKQYGFDNFCYIFKGNEFNGDANHFILSKKIPDTYPISRIRLGIKGDISWSHYIEYKSHSHNICFSK